MLDFLARVWGAVLFALSHPLFALIFGTFLAVMVPYARTVLERVADQGHWRDLGLPFDWRYLAMFLLPLLQIIVALFTTQGLLAVVSGWTWVYAVMLGYSGSDIAKEAAKAGSAIRRITAAIDLP